MGSRFNRLFQETKSVLRSPTPKQKEAYGRLSHTLCAAALISSVSVAFTESHATLYVVSKVSALVFWGVVLFWIGAVLSKGE